MIEIKNCEQLKSFLKKESKRLNISATNVYNTFFSRLLLYRLSKENIDKSIIVKGSFAQLVHLGYMVRPITDIDIASIKSHHDPLLLLIHAISEFNDYQINYDLRAKPYQTSTEIYKIPLSVNYGKINHPINIDYRGNYPIIFKLEVKKVPNIFEGDDEYEIALPSIEETLAEKLYVILKKNMIYDFSTRMKDFYDVYQLHGGEYDLDFFSFCFENMLLNSKHINISDVSTEFLSQEFVKEHNEEWENNKKKYEFLDDSIDLEGSVYYTRAVLSEQLQRIRHGKNKIYTLDYDSRNDKIV